MGKLKLSLSGDKKREERINWRSALYFVLGIVLTLTGVSFFALELKSTAKTPSLSRNLNKECALMFFDNHDLWHFFSALGLFFMFMAVLTLEDNNNDTPWKEMRVLDLTVGKLIGLLKGGGGSCGGHPLLEVKGNIAELLLDVTDNLTLSGGGERVASLGEDLHQVVGELTSSKVKTNDGVWESITLVDWDTVGDTVTGVHDNTGGTSGGVEGEDSLDGNIHGGHVEGLEHNLGH